MEWKIAPSFINYDNALATMAKRVEGIQRGTAEELAWLLEHPPLYTLGSSAKESDILPGSTLPSYVTGRGGQVTYHGPGQRVVYLMRDLKRHVPAGAAGPDLRAYVQDLEQWIILTLARFGVEGFVREGRIGVWVEQSSESRVQSSGTNHESRITNHEMKIAALGVRVQKWVTSHGIALNVNPDLSHYENIVPCGIRDYGVTSLAALGVKASMQDVDAVLKETFRQVFA